MRSAPEISKRQGLSLPITGPRLRKLRAVRRRNGSRSKSRTAATTSAQSAMSEAFALQSHRDRTARHTLLQLVGEGDGDVGGGGPLGAACERGDEAREFHGI